LRIMMLSHGYPPTLSGVTLVVQKISRALVRQGHQVLVITASERGEAYQSEDEGVQLERLRSIKNPFWGEGPLPWASKDTLEALVRSFRPDVIHTHENVILSVQLLRSQRMPGVPLISSCYFLPRFITHYLRLGSMFERAIKASIWRYIISNLNRYDQVIFSTRTQQEDFIQHGLRVPSSVISNGVNTRRYYPANGNSQEIEERYNLPPHPRILFVGRLMKDKKIDLLIQAMAQLRNEHEAHLLIVGRGDEKENLANQARELGLEDNVHLLGYVPEVDLPALYRSADLFAIASICEVQSIPALQAVATGLPIVAANAAALPELVRPEHNGLLVTPDDPLALGEALQKVTGDPAYRRELGRASLELADDHSEQETFRAYAKLYEEVVGWAGTG
jgi:1,2-diacylglycerol 3-alpha-glucosyltransferase